MAAASPAHFFRSEALDFITRRHRRLRVGILRQLCGIIERLRHQRCGLRTRHESGGSSSDTERNLEKFPAFHFASLLQSRANARPVSLRRYECVLNRAFMIATMGESR
jgi:hypothetical protein